MSPLPGWQVIPTGWAERHRPTAASSHVTPAEFRRVNEGPAPYPRPSDWEETQVIWTAPVRLQALKREGRGEQAEQPLFTREYQITCSVDGPELRVGEHGDVVVIGGREYRLTHRTDSSFEWERVFTAVDIQTQNP